MSTGRIDALGDGAARSRDLGSADLWERSLARSRQRRRLAVLNRRNRRRRKTVSLAVSASVAGGPILPTAVAAADSGSGSAAGGAGASTAAAVQSSAHVVLQVGSQGGLVAALQQRLNEVLPFSHLAVDGSYGPLTRSAVVNYQRHHGLLADGKVDTGMWARMFDAPVLVFGASHSAHGSTHAVTRSRTTIHRTRVKHAARDGGAALFRPARAGGRTHSNTPSPAANRSTGATLVAGGPGNAAATPPATANVNGSDGGAAIEVVAPTAPATTQVSTYVLTNGVALPLPRQYIVGGYVDQGVDYAAPGGTPEYAMGDGVIIGEGISGFGPNAPILKITSGPLAGLQVYYGHAGSDLVRVGQHVKAGQQITEVGYGIVGISTGPHLEIGFYPPGGMGAGSKMLSVINALLKQHPTGRAWGSTTTAAHVARDTVSGSTSSSATTSTVSTGGATSSSGGAAVGSDAAPQPAVSAAAPQPAAPGTTVPAQPASTPATTPVAGASAPDSQSAATPAPAPATTSDQTSTSTTAMATPPPAPSQEPSTTATASTSSPATTTPTPTSAPATTSPATTTAAGAVTTAPVPTTDPATASAPATATNPVAATDPATATTPAPSASPGSTATPQATSNVSDPAATSSP